MCTYQPAYSSGFDRLLLLELKVTDTYREGPSDYWYLWKNTEPMPNATESTASYITSGVPGDCYWFADIFGRLSRSQ
jgi:hypothetical protein